MKIFHKSLFDKDVTFALDDMRYLPFSEACTLIPWIILTMGMISVNFREALKYEFRWSFWEGFRLAAFYFGLMAGPFVLFPISIPLIMFVHWRVSKRLRKNMMIDALKGKFHGK
jgi:hypothetical protein